jgi:hypothetical protein
LVAGLPPVSFGCTDMPVRAYENMPVTQIAMDTHPPQPRPGQTIRKISGHRQDQNSQAYYIPSMI